MKSYLGKWFYLQRRAWFCYDTRGRLRSGNSCCGGWNSGRGGRYSGRGSRNSGRGGRYSGRGGLSCNIFRPVGSYTLTTKTK